METTLLFTFPWDAFLLKKAVSNPVNIHYSSLFLRQDEIVA
jgi:hypothetical protein